MILVKNIPYTTKESELRDIFERYGILKTLKISPFNTLAIVDYESDKQAKAAIKNLSYYQINYIMPIYLEFAPLTVFHDKIQPNNLAVIEKEGSKLEGEDEDP